MFWLREDVVLLSSGRLGLDLLLDQVELFWKSLLKANRLLRQLAKDPIYAERYSLLISIPVSITNGNLSLTWGLFQRVIAVGRNPAMARKHLGEIKKSVPC